MLESRSGHYIALLLDRAEGVMPHELHEVLDPYLHKLEKELEPGAKPETESAAPPRFRSTIPTSVSRGAATRRAPTGAQTDSD